MKNKLLKRFKKAFCPSYRLLAVHLNGFSHSVFFDKGNKKSDVSRLEFSGCAPEISFDPRVKELFEGVPHYCYQGAPEEIIYILPNNR